MRPLPGPRAYFRWMPVSICSTGRPFPWRGEEEVEIDEGEAELGFYQGGGMELEDILREQILLAMPMQRVCREDCKGICPTCGGNRNETPCDCKPRARRAPVGRFPRSERPENILKSPRFRGKLL